MTKTKKKSESGIPKRFKYSVTVPGKQQQLLSSCKSFSDLQDLDGVWMDTTFYGAKNSVAMLESFVSGWEFGHIAGEMTREDGPLVGQDGYTNQKTTDAAEDDEQDYKDDSNEESEG